MNKIIRGRTFETGSNFGIRQETIWNRSGISLENFVRECSASTSERKVVCGTAAG